MVVSFLTKINIQVAIAARGLGIRRIASERNNFVQQKMKPHWRLLMPIALATAEVAVMQTHAARTALPAWARKRAVVIHNPVPEGIERSTEAPPPRRLVAVGRLTEQKGFDILIRAVGQAHERNCPFDLTIYGEGKDRKRLADLVQSLGLSGRIRLAGRTQRPHEWTKGAGIFVLSSRFEGFPNVLVEAMAAGFAVVSTTCDWGPSEVLTHGRDGLLVPLNDPEALADALVELWHDDALRTQFARAATLRAADFSEQRILSEWDAAIAQALGAQARATSEAPSRP